MKLSCLFDLAPALWRTCLYLKKTQSLAGYGSFWVRNIDLMMTGLWTLSLLLVWPEVVAAGWNGWAYMERGEEPGDTPIHPRCWADELNISRQLSTRA